MIRVLHRHYEFPQSATHVRRLRRVCYCLLVTATFIASPSQLRSQQPGASTSTELTTQTPQALTQATPLEQKVKAAYLYHFCRYFEWPADEFSDPAQPFVIGVFGDDPLGPQLDKLAKKKSVKNRKIKVVRFETVDQFQPCQLLFVTRTITNDQFAEALKITEATSTLVVSERSIPTSQGSAVHLYVDETDTVGFEIDIDIVNDKNLRVSAKLLKLARASSPDSNTASK